MYVRNNRSRPLKCIFENHSRKARGKQLDQGNDAQKCCVLEKSAKNAIPDHRIVFWVPTFGIHWIGTLKTSLLVLKEAEIIQRNGISVTNARNVNKRIKETLPIDSLAFCFGLA